MRGKESSLRPSPVWKSVFSELDMASESLLWGQVVYDHSFVGSRQIAGLIIFFFFWALGRLLLPTKTRRFLRIPVIQSCAFISGFQQGTAFVEEPFIPQ